MEPLVRLSEFAASLRLRCFDRERQQDLVQIWRVMLTARIFTKHVQGLCKKRRIHKKWVFSGNGQELGAATVAQLLTPSDIIIPSYRGYALPIGRGITVEALLMEVLGKEEGPAEGGGNAANFSSPVHGLLQSSHVLGLDFGTVLGVGLALRSKTPDAIAAIFFGDGAASRGPLWSALNCAAVWKLPILWVCENNQYSITTPSVRVMATSIHAKARQTGLVTYKVNGNDPIAVLTTIVKAIRCIRTRRRPVFVELETYRLDAHDEFYFKDAYECRDKMEVIRWELRDPLPRTEILLKQAGILNANHVEHEKEKINTEMAGLLARIA